MQIEAITIGGILCLAYGIYFSLPRKTKKVTLLNSVDIILAMVRKEQKCRKP